VSGEVKDNRVVRSHIVPQLTRVKKERMMKGDLRVEMFLLKLFVISVVLKATRVMLATVMRKSVSDAERRAIL